jgi:hypothetical protein
VYVKELREQRASLLVVKAKTLFSIAKIMREEEEEEERGGRKGENREVVVGGEIISALGWQAYEYHAHTAARSAYVIYIRALTQSLAMFLNKEGGPN